MSPYGASAGGSAIDSTLATRVFHLPTVSEASLAVVHLTLATLPAELETYLRDVRLFLHHNLTDREQVFNTTVKDGRTYPQEQELDAASFRAYYLAADLFVGVWIARDESVSEDTSRELPASATLESLVAGRAWPEAVVGMYYVKPNYPAHICNGGFVVPPVKRGSKIGLALARSFLLYAPLLGFKANLVYANNTASLAIWDRLGFKRVGLVPQAGRLRTADGKGEELVDAVVYWRSLV